MPLCVYCDAAYDLGDRACAACRAPTQLDSPYPVITGELVLADCPACGAERVVPFQAKCPGGCDLAGRWERPDGRGVASRPDRPSSTAVSLPIGRNVSPSWDGEPTEEARDQDAPTPLSAESRGGEDQQGPACPDCQVPTRADARFCDRCGTRLHHACRTCGADNRPGATWCAACGAELLPEASTSQTGVAASASSIPSPGHGPEPAQPAAAPRPTPQFQLVVLGQSGAEQHRFDLGDGDHLVGAESPGEEIHPEIDLGPFDLGRHLSRRHAVLRVEKGKVYVADHPGSSGRGSTNGTWWQGGRVPMSMIEVPPGSELVFGKLRTRIISPSGSPGC